MPRSLSRAKFLNKETRFSLIHCVLADSCHAANGTLASSPLPITPFFLCDSIAFLSMMKGLFVAFAFEQLILKVEVAQKQSAQVGVLTVTACTPHDPKAHSFAEGSTNSSFS